MHFSGMYDFIRDGDLELTPNLGDCLPVKRLVEIKRIALRHGSWYRSLSRIERGIVDLTIRYVDDVKSSKLAKVLTAITNKLESAMENALDRLVRIVGLPLAQKISQIAVNWGNRLAALWATDLSFANFLAIASASFSKTMG